MTRPPVDAPLLVIAHEGFRNGATKVLAALLPQVAANLTVPIRVQVQTEGPLAGALRALSTDVDPGVPPRAVFVNSALGAAALWSVARDIGALVYVHEEGEALATLPSEAKRALTERADVVACVSARSQRDLEDLGVAAERIQRIPPVIDAVVPDEGSVAQARDAAGIPDDHPLVLGCGEATWRKGADLFVELARHLGPSIRCAWVGRRTRSFARQLDHDAGLAGVESHLHWVGEVDDALPLLAAADAFVLVSRVDPQPLVPLEAAIAGTATIGFVGTGLDDLAGRGGAKTVPYPDVPGLANLVREVLDDPLSGAPMIEVARSIATGERSSSAVIELLLPTLRTLLERPAGARP